MSANQSDWKSTALGEIIEGLGKFFEPLIGGEGFECDLESEVEFIGELETFKEKAVFQALQLGYPTVDFAALEMD